MLLLYVALAGGIGATVRFVVDTMVRTVLGRGFPWGTLIINVVGSFALGIMSGLVLYHHAQNETLLILGTGFCGGFTTFSTASFEAARLIEEKRYTVALLQVSSNLSFALLAAAAGIWLIQKSF